jgi:hypothetical protein
VILTGAFLAEQAATIDNKLNVAGGVLSKFTLGPDRSASFVLVVLTRADADSDNSDRRIEVELIPPTGEAPVLRRFEVPEASIGEFPGFAFFGIDANLPVDGRSAFRCWWTPGHRRHSLAFDEPVCRGGQAVT